MCAYESQFYVVTISEIVAYAVLVLITQVTFTVAFAFVKRNFDSSYYVVLPVFQDVLQFWETFLRYFPCIRKIKQKPSLVIVKVSYHRQFAKAFHRPVHINIFTDVLHVLGCQEWQLFEKLYENAGRIVTTGILCETICGAFWQGYESTLSTHIRHLREKIEANPSKPVSLVTAKGLGYRLNLKGAKS